jgi:hypothetical protein
MDDEDGRNGFLIEVGEERHVLLAEEISEVMEESARARGTGISKRSPALIAQYIREGKAAWWP